MTFMVGSKRKKQGRRRWRPTMPTNHRWMKTAKAFTQWRSWRCALHCCALDTLSPRLFDFIRRSTMSAVAFPAETNGISPAWNAVQQRWVRQVAGKKWIFSNARKRSWNRKWQSESGWLRLRFGIIGFSSFSALRIIAFFTKFIIELPVDQIHFDLLGFTSTLDAGPLCWRILIMSINQLVESK